MLALFIWLSDWSFGLDVVLRARVRLGMGILEGRGSDCRGCGGIIGELARDDAGVGIPLGPSWLPFGRGLLPLGVLRPPVASSLSNG